MLLRAAVLIEGLRLDGDLHVGGVRVIPVAIEHGFSGRELREPLNALLAEHGFVSMFGRPVWAAQIGPQRRLSFAVAPAIEVPEIVEASQEASARLAQLVDALSVTHGGAPRIFASVHEQSDDGDAWRPFALMVGGGIRPGSVLERLLPDEDRLLPIEPLDVWARALADPLVSLWQSLYRGIAGEQRWDTKILRCCTLLEAIGRERLHDKAEVREASGRRLLDEHGKPAKTNTLRGKLYALASDAVGSIVTSPRALLCHDSRNLWNEVGVWADVRNMVAHEGLWKPPHITSTLRAEQRRTAAAFELAGRGDGLEAGWLRYTDAVSAGTEAVLRAIVLEQGSPTRG